MSKKAIDKEYLLSQLENYEDDVISDHYVDVGLMSAFVDGVNTSLNKKIESITVNGQNVPINNKTAEISVNTGDVSFTQELSSGTKIGAITINNSSTDLYAPNPTSESDISRMGFTKNAGTITGITMNGASVGTSGNVNLGNFATVATSGDYNDLVNTPNFMTTDDLDEIINQLSI